MLILASALSRITVSLRRLKHFDCKEKHALLVGVGTGNLAFGVYMCVCVCVCVCVCMCVCARAHT